MKGVAVSQLDAARLILDAVERLSTGEESTPPREQLLSKLKRVVELGTQAVLAEEATESFANVAWQSVEARKGRRASTQRDLRHFVRRIQCGVVHTGKFFFCNEKKRGEASTGVDSL